MLLSPSQVQYPSFTATGSKMKSKKVARMAPSAMKEINRDCVGTTPSASGNFEKNQFCKCVIAIPQQYITVNQLIPISHGTSSIPIPNTFPYWYLPNNNDVWTPI